MQRTQSEEFFEQYCVGRDYRCEAIPTDRQKSADYLVRAGAYDLIVEVKELCASDDDRRQIRELKERQCTTGGGQPGRRAGELIKRAAKQLGRYRNRQIPLVVLLYDNIVVDGYRPGFTNGFLQPSFIDFGMYGLQTVNLVVDHRIGEIRYGGDGRGGERQATATERTYLSAVAVLYQGELAKEMFVAVYHNYFATIPLSRKVFSGPADRHFVKPGHPDLTPQAWEELKACG